jgi:hypothetical protein
MRVSTRLTRLNELVKKEPGCDGERSRAPAKETFAAKAGFPLLGLDGVAHPRLPHAMELGH